jgi:hypothetical protein
MSSIKHHALRKIAENELAKHLGDLDAAVRNELATSLVRQWITNEGFAGLVMPTRRYWFRMIAKEDGGLELGVSKSEGNWDRVLTEEWHIDKEEVAGLLHRLNLCQFVLCRTIDGRTVRLRIEPKERTLRCEEAKAEEAES